MGDGVGQTVEQSPVHLCLGTADMKLDLLPLGPGKVAHRPWEATGDRTERKHPHLECGILELAEQALLVVDLLLQGFVRVERSGADHMLESVVLDHRFARDIQQSVDLLRCQAYGRARAPGGRRY